MSLYKQKHSTIWWYEFQFNGEKIRESTRTRSRKLAEQAERTRRRALEEAFNGIKKRELPKLFSVAAAEYLSVKQAKVSAATLEIERRGVECLQTFFGKKLIIDITAIDIKAFADWRLAAGASPRYTNMNLGTLRGILLRNRLWDRIRPDVSMLRVPLTHGKALTKEEEDRLLVQCQDTISRILYPAVMLGLSTGMRKSEIRLLRWSQVNLDDAYLVVGFSKTANSTGRKVPINNRALQALQAWASEFPHRHPQDYVLPQEKYCLSGEPQTVTIYRKDPSKPVGDWKTAWKKACKRSKLRIRFHDLRHTAVTRMLEAGIPLTTVAAIVGWSPSTMYLMAKRYGHIGETAMRTAVAALE